MRVNTALCRPQPPPVWTAQAIGAIIVGMTARGIVIGMHFQVETIDFAAGAGVRGTDTYRPFLMSGRARARLDLVGPAIRKGLLYFDRIDWPLTNFEAAMLPGVEVLEAQGFLQRPRIGVADSAQANMGVGAVEGAHRWHFAQLAAQTDCLWACARRRACSARAFAAARGCRGRSRSAACGVP